jgi:hypothetical protein
VRETTVRYDRCAATISGGAAVPTLQGGNLRARLHQPVDLCQACAGKLVEWIATARDAKGTPLRLEDR